MHKTSQQKQSQHQHQPPMFESTVGFSHARAIIWQIKFTLSNVTSKKTLEKAVSEIQNLSELYGKEFDKYLLRELIEQLDFKDAQKSSKEKHDTLKVQILNQELLRISQKPEFLQYISEVAQHFFHDKPNLFIDSLNSKVKLTYAQQLLISLGLYESMKEEPQLEILKYLKVRLQEGIDSVQKLETLPEYALHRIIYHFNRIVQQVNILSENQQKQEKSEKNEKSEQIEELWSKVQEALSNMQSQKNQSHIAMREILTTNGTEDPSLSMMKEGTGLENLDKVNKILEPWEILLDLGHYSSYNYNYLLNSLSDFKDINEKVMAKTILYLSLHHSGQDDLNSRIVYTVFEASKKGQTPQIKDQSEKKTPMIWSIDNLSRLFRELYSNLQWLKVFEAIAEIDDDIQLDAKGFNTFLQIFNKSKPQNLAFPLNVILDTQWANPFLQVNFIENCIQVYIDKKDKCINFQKTQKRQENVEDLQGIKDKVSPELLHVWQSIELSERLIELSNTQCFSKVKQIFESPLKAVPEYLLLALSQTKPTQGNLLLDELLSQLLPLFLGTHINSIPVLQQLWKNNQQLMIRGIYELYKHDNRIMNLSRVLDITQEVKESLIPIVGCEDYYFAVNLGILAGKRDFLHYDVWLQSRISEVGTPFIKALLRYIKEHILIPINEYLKKHTNPANGHYDVTPDAIENQKNQILEKSHFNKEKLCITLEHLQNPSNQTNQKIKPETMQKIKEVVLEAQQLFPSQMTPIQNSEEIDNAANDYFQRVFSADPNAVDQKISELIEIMQKFKESEIKKEQEIYACMLHSLFDEYRFLHKYPQQYLEKIAKLFGQIIKNKIIDGILQEIALKFAFEAYRREGRRQKFGIIVIKQFFDMLPQFPVFFKDIYDIRQNLSQTDPQMIIDLERLYEQAQIQAEKEKAQMKLEQSSEEQKSENAPERKHKESMSKHDKSQPQENKQDKKQSEKQLMNDELANQFRNSLLQSTNDKDGSSNQKQSALSSAFVLPSQQQQQKPNAPQQENPQVMRINTPSNLTQAAAFIPTSKLTAEQTSLNINSTAFKRTNNPQPITQPALSQPQPQTTTTTSMNLNVGIFRPTAIKSTSPLSTIQNKNPYESTQSLQQVNPIMDQLQKLIDGRILRAQQENTKIRIEDLIEDATLLPPNSDMLENMKMICNTTGKNNFTQRLQELKELIGFTNNPKVGIFIHYVITKRVATASSQTLNNIYIDLIRQVGIKGSVDITVLQIVDCLKKCMVINEEAFFKICQRANNTQNPIKNCIINISSFLGGLTLANNRPVFAKEIDLKQLIVEAFQQDKQEKLKYVVVFICRTLKEAANQKSSIFKAANPWINSLLSLLREVKEWLLIQTQPQQLTAQSTSEINNEIDGLFKAFQIQNINDIQNNGIIKALITQQFNSSSLQLELSYLLGKSSLLPVLVRNSQSSSIAPPVQQNDSSLEQQQQTSSQQIQQQLPGEIYNRVTVSQEVMQNINRLVPQTEQQIRKMVADAVDSSIVEILPPVVDRSVTIALITTRELVLKDFAYDGDPDKILKAADLIVKNLAGSLALVTCREPLKMSLTTNLKKTIVNLTGEAQEIQGQISEIAQNSSKENLELGCKLIKKAVIEKAQTKVREEPQIAKAIEKRKQFKEMGGQYYKDERIASQFSDLPEQLKPNPKGLTDAQFQVYEDFARFNSMRMHKQMNAGQKQAVEMESYEADDLEQILKVIEKTGVNGQLKGDLINKIVQINTQEGGKTEDSQKLWGYSKKWLHNICEKFAIHQKQQIQQEFTSPLLEGLSIIVAQYKQEDFSKKLTHEFLSLNDSLFINVDLNVLLFKNQVISVSEWDNQISMFLKESAGMLQDNVLQFFSSVLKVSILEQKVLIYEQVPNSMQVVEYLSKDEQIATFFSQILADYKKKPSLQMQNIFESYFDEWVRIAYGESSTQKQDINRFFSDLSQTEFFKDYENTNQKQSNVQSTDMMFSFCKVMVKKSIRKALYLDNGEKRPSDRLEYRYNRCVIKLIIILMKALQNFNKHKFMIKLFEAIFEVLEEDSRVSKHEFNQKPYFSLLMNILTAIHLFNCFNPQTQQLILLSLADLFIKLNPNKYPAFAFAWLNLISHKFFMPHFLKQTPAFPQQQVTGQQNSAQYMKKGGQGSGGASTSSVAAQDIAGNDNIFFNKYFKFKELLVSLFTFLKTNLIPNQRSPPALVAFYQATLRVCLAIFIDFPEFFCDFHFNFVNSLPDHCIQLRNIILSSYPQNIQIPNPFQKSLKVDLLTEVQSVPKILSNFENYLQLRNLREDLESYVRSKNQNLINAICEKMMQSEEEINGRRKIHCNVINAVVLFIANQAFGKQTIEMSNKECMEFFKVLCLKLNNETRNALLNSIVNELRYPNKHTYFFSCIILYIFSECNKEIIQEQITRQLYYLFVNALFRIMLERLQVYKPQPWGLMISFRELIQNPKYGFMKKSYIAQNMPQIEALFANRLQYFIQFIPKQNYMYPQQQQQQQFDQNSA